MSAYWLIWPWQDFREAGVRHRASVTLRHVWRTLSEYDDLVRVVSPHLDSVLVERVWAEGGTVYVAARTRELMVGCPECGRGSARVHSRYGRSLADVAVGGRPVLNRPSVRRLFCDSPECGRRTFTEQVEGLTVRYQRRSPLLQYLVEMARVLLAGRGGARLLRIMKVPLSRTSVLSHVMRLPLPPTVALRVLGVDDFALYAGATEPCWWTPTPGCRWSFGPGAMPSSWRPGCGGIRALRWSAGRASPTVPRVRCRSTTTSSAP